MSRGACLLAALAAVGGCNAIWGVDALELSEGAPACGDGCEEDDTCDRDPEVTGDCARPTCIGGQPTTVDDPGDVMDDGQECTAESCVEGAPVNELLAAGSACEGGVCDGDGHCLDCVTNADCTLPETCGGAGVPGSCGCAFGQDPGCPGTSCAEILAADPSLTTGVYWLQPSMMRDAVEVACEMDVEGGGWTVIDVKRAPVWMTFFASWSVYDASTSGATAQGQPSPSHLSWRQWFQGAPGAELRLSPDCLSVTDTGGSEQVYSATGNFYGCRWYNDNCNMDVLGCHSCQDDFGGTTNGTCTHLVSAPDEDYDFDCATDWWNRAPAIGTDGTHCVAYR